MYDEDREEEEVSLPLCGDKAASVRERDLSPRTEQRRQLPAAVHENKELVSKERSQTRAHGGKDHLGETKGRRRDTRHLTEQIQPEERSWIGGANSGTRWRGGVRVMIKGGQ